MPMIDATKWDEFYQEMTKDLKPYDHYDDGYRDAMDNVDDWMDGNQVEAEPVRHGYWETVLEVRDNTVCGNGVKIEYKRCSCCKNPAKFLEDDFCGYCGAKLDLPQPPKGE